MAGSLNKVVLIGNLGRDPEIRTTNDGKEIANFSIATSDSWRDKVTGEKKEKTEWHKIVIFSEGLVKVVKNYVKKGSKIYIEGQLQTRKWNDDNNQEKYTTEVVLQGYNATLILLDAKSDNNGFSSETRTKPDNKFSKDFENSDIDDEIPW
ncbi:MAG: single-stranded DNA-binding protein [Rickettsiaceae bacterium]|nr:single-stranded DNA-binding protein [Rickettsiaceae bacterium]